MEQLPPIVFVLAGALTTIGFLLARRRLRLPGCGAGSGCDAVAATRWAWIGSVPVARIGFGLYLLILLLALTETAAARHVAPEWLPSWSRLLFMLCSATAAWAGVWFLALQAVILRQYCLYCCLAHGVAILMAVLLWHSIPEHRGILWLGMAPVALMIAGQLLLPARQWEEMPLPQADSAESPMPAEIPTPIRTDDPAAPTKSVSAAAATPIVLSVPRREVVLAGGALKLQLSDWPLHGRGDAPAVVLLLHDPTCKTCREMHRVAIMAVEQNPELAVIAIPVPQDPACNPGAARSKGEKPTDACQLTRLILCLQRIDPSVCDTFQRWFLDFPDKTLPPFEAALRKAKKLAPDPMAAHWPPLPAVEGRLRTALAIFHAARAKQVPTLVFPRKAVVGLIPTANDLVKIVEAEFASVQGRR